MQQEIERKIEVVSSFLPRIMELPLDEFHSKIHSLVEGIAIEANQFPQHKESLRRTALDYTHKELTKGILQNHIINKPFGYAGDFQVIDWIYKQVKNLDFEKGLWDEFGNIQDAVVAVRNRKDYFVKVFCELCAQKERPISLLNLACGPCRDIAQAIEAAGKLSYGSQIHCVDIEPLAISYAQKVTRPYTSKVNFEWELSNVFRIRTTDSYDLTWSAGLFDYLNDRLAIALLKKMWSLTKSSGRLIVGNFHPRNPTRNYMEWCLDWILIHRTEEELLQLGIEAGISKECMHIDQEPLGVCIFLVAEKQ